MDLMEAIWTRRSIRTYMDVPVEWAKLTTIAEAGMMAPSAGNLQIWRFVIVRTPEKRKAIAEACLQQYWMAQAAAHIVIFAKLTREEQFYGIRGTRLYSIQDCAMAAQNMLLTTHALGLGGCFVSAFDEEAIARIFNLPEDVRPQGVITVGYTDERPDVPSRYRVETLIGVEKYGMAMNEGGGRVADPLQAVGTYRYVQRGTGYVQDAVSDVGKVIKHHGKKFVEKAKKKENKKEE